MAVNSSFSTLNLFFARYLQLCEHLFQKKILSIEVGENSRIYDIYDYRGQFHQHSMHSFYVRKLGEQLFCAYILGLYFIGVSLLAQKLLIERWWNWPQDDQNLFQIM